MNGRQNVRFSLYLSSQLMFGLFSVLQRKVEILHEDVKNFADRIVSYRKELHTSIDLVEPASGFRVTFDEPNLENVPIDFGSFLITGFTPVHELSYEYFIVSTPKSPDEWQISPGRPEDRQRAVTGSGDEHTARPEDITMPEEPLSQAPQVLAQDDFADIFHGLRDVDFPDQPVSFFADIPETEREVPEREPEALAVDDIKPPIERDLPDVDDQQQNIGLSPQGPSVSVSEPPPNRTTSLGSGAQVLPSPRPDGARRRSSGNGEPSLVLGPIASTDRRGRTRRRRRHLIVDQETMLSRQQMLNNFDSANDCLVRPLEIPSLWESAESLLTRLGSRAAAEGNRRFWHYPRTLPEPNDPSPYCLFTEEEPRAPELPAVSDLITEGVSEPDITGEDIQRPRSREAPRAGETQNDIHPLSTTESKAFSSFQCSRTLQDTQDQSSAAAHYLGVPYIGTPDLSRRDDVGLIEDILPEPLTSEAAAEPEILIHEPEVVLEEPEREKIDISAMPEREPCIVSPERTSPPPSLEVPSSPLADRAMAYIKEAFEESDVPNSTTFTSLIRKTPGTRTYIAKLFSVLLDLHALSFIIVHQPEPEGEIFITDGPNFLAFD